MPGRSVLYASLHARCLLRSRCRAFFRGQFPNTLPVRPYGLIGVSYIETTANFPGGGSDGENYKDLSLGLGADITITNQIFLSVEYLRAVDRSGDEVSNLGFGINGRF